MCKSRALTVRSICGLAEMQMVSVPEFSARCFAVRTLLNFTMVRFLPRVLAVDVNVAIAIARLPNSYSTISQSWT